MFSNLRICGKFNEIDYRAKGIFWLFGLSQSINKVYPSSEPWKITFYIFSFSNYHLSIHGLLLFTCAIIRKQAHPLLWFALLLKKLLIYRSKTSDVIGFRIKIFHSSFFFWSFFAEAGEWREWFLFLSVCSFAFEMSTFKY